MGNSVIARSCLEAFRWWLMVCMLLSQNACLHSGARNSAQIPKFKSIALVNKGATKELTKRFSVARDGSSVDNAIIAGSGAGAEPPER